MRGLIRQPGFAVFVIVTLALGIGANATMFGVADRLLLRGPEHVRDAARVARVYSTESVAGMGDFTTDGVGYVTYALLRHGTRSFEGVAGYAVNDITMRQEGTDAASIRGGYATADFFPLLGVGSPRPLLRRRRGPDIGRRTRRRPQRQALEAAVRRRLRRARSHGNVRRRPVRHRVWRRPASLASSWDASTSGSR
jgi:hypothetical protein